MHATGEAGGTLAAETELAEQRILISRMTTRNERDPNISLQYFDSNDQFSLFVKCHQRRLKDLKTLLVG